MIDRSIHFHSFPNKTSGIRVQIVNALGATEVTDKRKAWKKVVLMGKPVSKYMRVCSKHFTNEDYCVKVTTRPKSLEHYRPNMYSLQYGAQYNFSKRKGGQVRFTSIQTDTLENQFHFNKYLLPEKRKLLADNLKLTDRQVKTWFQNRRAKWRRNQSTEANTSIST